MIRRTITKPLRRLLEARQLAPCELGRLLDAHVPGARLVVDGTGDRCWWTLPGGLRSPTVDVAGITREAAAAGLSDSELATALARLDDDPAGSRAVLELAAGRRPTSAGPSPAELRRIATRQMWPHLVVKPAPLPRQWWWEILAPDGRTLAPSATDDTVLHVLPSQQAALEVGLAHLAVVSASWAVDVHGAVLPPGFERVLPAASSAA